MNKPVRRIVTGHNATGKSVIKQDGLPPVIKQFDAIAGLTFFELWETTTSPANNRGEADPADRPVHLQPQAQGSIFRILDIPPDTVNSEEAKAVFNEIQAGDTHQEGGANPNMHLTNSVDYAIVISGEIWAVMDEEEVLMKAGDVLIQRGTNHAWSVRTTESCRIAFILIGADPLC